MSTDRVKLKKTIEDESSSSTDVGRDARITFVEDNHTYIIDGKPNTHTSCTALIKLYTTPFNADDIITKMQASMKWNSANKYFKMSREEIKQQWSTAGKEASSKGTMLHKMIERFYLNGMKLTDDEAEKANSLKEFELFLMFHNEVASRYKGYLAVEKKIFCDVNHEKICGTVDMLYSIDDSNKVALVDFKRIKKLDGVGYKKMKPPLQHMDDCNFNSYSLQLSIYRFILEKYYDLIVMESFILILHPNNDRYFVVALPHLKKEVELLMNVCKS